MKHRESRAWFDGINIATEFKIAQESEVNVWRNGNVG